MNMNIITKKQKNEILNTFTTQTIIRKWGNSQGIRLSKEILSQMDLKEDDTIGISIYNGKMIIEKVNKPKYLNLEERLEAFYKRPIDEIYVESTQEVDVGDPVGNEKW
ncbi:MAG: AbrB/MazE/SpoVT family DNA-binding domain-containing protein [Lachnospiraceae bacterium]|jgi:antitoxin MazE|nr:AbrB/MazE/SpoVT family DNA-binding domain-containing protein [Lachnospiraceae bacterium]